MQNCPCQLAMQSCVLCSFVRCGTSNQIEKEKKKRKELFNVKLRDEFIDKRLEMRWAELQRIGDEVSITNEPINRLYKQIYSIQNKINEAYNEKSLIENCRLYSIRALLPPKQF